MMASLAAGEYGVALVLRQFSELGRLPTLEVLTWRKLISTIIEYCVRYNSVLEQVRHWDQGMLQMRACVIECCIAWLTLLLAVSLVRALLHSATHVAKPAHPNTSWHQHALGSCMFPSPPLPLP
jgi:hypothetical protein